ncbi:MAG TPA: hypothetical protein ENO20_08820 [Bacteroides sp.]|nr:hypothetical protein [Bacteroides sp.]
MDVWAQGYQNFKVAVYCRAYEVEKMNDPGWLTTVWDGITRQVHVDKVYLETHRDLLMVDEETLQAAIDFFTGRGIEVAGGITYTVNESNYFETFCYTNPGHRDKVKQIATYTARFFDEFILDDFFFTSCKCDLCIAAKKEMSWTDYRLELMKDAAVKLVLEPAREVNPDVEVVIKYPNWYEHFQGLGFNLEAQPALFEGLYTGTETRNRSGNQHLQQYHGYAIFRYFENLKPGQNRGGWVDTGGSDPLDRYAEQLWLTLFAKAPEITLFDIRQMQYPVRDNTRAEWQGTGTSFDFDKMKEPIKQADGSMSAPVTYARAAGYSLEVVDRVLGSLGRPVGIKSYRPYHAVGEDFLQNYLGMIGIPIEIVPEFPGDGEMVLLTETAGHDPQIVEKIKTRLKQGKNVTVTSGLYRSLQGHGIEDIAELRVTDRKAGVKEFTTGWGPPVTIEKEIIIPQIQYLTNDSWEVISALDDTNGWPVLHRADYSEGELFVLTVPDNFIDFYNMPVPVLNRLRQEIAGSLDVLLEGPSEVSLFVYDNHSFVVESFLDEEVTFRIVVDSAYDRITDVSTGEVIMGELREAPSYRGRKLGRDSCVFEITLKPHSFKAFQF